MPYPRGVDETLLQPETDMCNMFSEYACGFWEGGEWVDRSFGSAVLSGVKSAGLRLTPQAQALPGLAPGAGSGAGDRPPAHSSSRTRGKSVM